LLDLSFEEYQEFSSLFEEDIYEVLSPEHVVAVRNSFGGTSPEQVIKQIELAQGKIGK
jgi:argininosuccinate lyase